MKTYPTDLTESQWQVIENIVDPNQRSILSINEGNSFTKKSDGTPDIWGFNV